MYKGNQSWPKTEGFGKGVQMEKKKNRKSSLDFRNMVNFGQWKNNAKTTPFCSKTNK